MKPVASLAASLLFLAPALAGAEPMTFDCVAEPAQRVQIGTPVTGLLASVEVGRGARVMPGDVVARLESTVEEANVALAGAQAEADEAVRAQQTRLSLAEADLTRSKKLATSGSVSTSRSRNWRRRSKSPSAISTPRSARGCLRRSSSSGSRRC